MKQIPGIQNKSSNYGRIVNFDRQRFVGDDVAAGEVAYQNAVPVNYETRSRL